MRMHEDSAPYGFPDCADTPELQQVWLELNSYDFEERLHETIETKPDMVGYWITARILDAYVTLGLDYRNVCAEELLPIVEEWALQQSPPGYDHTLLIAGFHDTWGFYIRPQCLNSLDAVLYLKQFGYMNGELDARVHYGTKKFTQMLGQLAGAMRLYSMMSKEPYISENLVMKFVDTSKMTARMLLKTAFQFGIIERSDDFCSWSMSYQKPLNIAQWVPLELRDDPPTATLKKSSIRNVVKFQKSNDDHSKN